MGRLIKYKDNKDLCAKAVEVKHVNYNLMAVAKAKKIEIDLINSSKERLINLSLKMAEKIAGRAIDLSPEILTSIYFDAMSTVKATGPGVINISPRQTGNEEFNKVALQLGFNVVADETLGLYDCVVKTEIITVDAKLETALYLFKKVLED